MDLITKKRVVQAVLLYYWGLIGLLNLSLPIFFGLSVQTKLCWLCVGCLLWDYIGLDKKVLESLEMQVYGLQELLGAPQVITSKGVFSWDGVVRRRSYNGLEYVCFRSAGADTGVLMEDPFGASVVCPVDHVVDLGRHRVICSELRVVSVESLPDSLVEEVGMGIVYRGDTRHPVFGKPSQDMSELMQHKDLLESRVKNQEFVLRGYENLIAGMYVVLKNLQNSVMDDHSDVGMFDSSSSDIHMLGGFP